MSRSPAAFAFLSLSVFLVIWPLTVQKPGLPYSMKADEPAYYLMARSLWEDRDLRCEVRDLQRTHDDYFYDVENLILLSKDGWQSAYYAKPYIGSLLAAPWVAAFGANGFVAMNMALLLLATWMGWVYLARSNESGLALLAAAAYFFLSTAFQYVFWLQPEIVVLTSLTATLFFAAHTFAEDGGRWSRFAARWQFVIAGLAAGAVVNIKPPYAVFLLPPLLCAWRRRRPRDVLALVAGVMLSTAAIAGGQKLMTDTWSPYLGAMRRGFNVRNPTVLPIAEARAVYLSDVEHAELEKRARLTPESTGKEREIANVAGTDWGWVFALPDVNRTRLWNDVVAYFIGRHTGAFVYYPFLLLALLYFASGGGWRDPWRWGILVSGLLLSAFLLLWNQENYYGGGGFVGNRYLVPVYPAGLFLISRLRPRALLLVGFLLGGLFLGQIVFAPLGPAVDSPTLQAYARAIPFRWLPGEADLSFRIPGYRGVSQGGAWIVGRRDRISFHQDWFGVLSAEEAELIFESDHFPAEAYFLLRSWAPGNRVRIELGDARVEHQFPDEAPPAEGHTALVAVPVPEPDRQYRQVWYQPVRQSWFLRIRSRSAAKPGWYGGTSSELLGVRFLHLGEKAVVERDVYGIEWRGVGVPEQIQRGEHFVVRARFANTSPSPWTAESPARVNLAYRWQDLQGREVPAVLQRTSVPGGLLPGAEAEVDIKVSAPDAVGPHRLVLEPVYEYVRWFGDLDPDARRVIDVCIDEPAPKAAVPLR